jgi:hypothetical protein
MSCRRTLCKTESVVADRNISFASGDVASRGVESACELPREALREAMADLRLAFGGARALSQPYTGQVASALPCLDFRGERAGSVPAPACPAAALPTGPRSRTGRPRRCGHIRKPARPENEGPGARTGRRYPMVPAAAAGANGQVMEDQFDHYLALYMRISNHESRHSTAEQFFVDRVRMHRSNAECP